MNREGNEMAKTAKFSTRKAADAIFKIMKQMGIKTRKPSNGSWINYEKDEATICLGCNTFFISVTEAGVSFYSRAAVFGGWSKRTKSFRSFKQQMGHVMFYMS